MASCVDGDGLRWIDFLLDWEMLDFEDRVFHLCVML